MTGWNSQCLYDIIQLGIHKCNMHMPLAAVLLHANNTYNIHTRTWKDALSISIQCTHTHRFAFAQDEPPIDDSQDIESASAERVDGVTTITFNRPRNSGDINDTSLDECRFFLFAYGGQASFFLTMPPVATYHGPGPTRRAASLERICIPTFTECSAGEFTTVLLLPLSISVI